MRVKIYYFIDGTQSLYEGNKIIIKKKTMK